MDFYMCYCVCFLKCSEVCGGGEQQRIVTCPEEDQCDRVLQPSNIQPCNFQPCAQWLTGSWGQVQYATQTHTSTHEAALNVTKQIKQHDVGCNILCQIYDV